MIQKQIEKEKTFEDVAKSEWIADALIQNTRRNHPDYEPVDSIEVWPDGTIWDITENERIFDLGEIYANDHVFRNQ